MPFDFTKLPEDLKNELLNAFTLPLWYVSIYLFCPSVYNKGDVILSVSLCISLALVSTIISNITFYGILTSAKKEEEDITYMATFFLQTLWLSFLIFASYIFSCLTNLIFEFYGFLVTYILIFPIIFISYYIRKRKKLSKKKSKV